MQSILRTEGLSHQYTRSAWAIRDINLEIGRHGIVGLLGSNGAGKSTTMNIICGALNQTEGKVLIDGIDLREKPEAAKQRIGFLPQQPPLYTDLTVDEYLTFCAEIRCMEPSRIKKALEEAKERCALTHVSSRLISNLSGGYRQRVGIAQAIIHKPRLVVLDEPTNGLDPNQLIEVRKLIREIAQEHAVLFSSHIMSEIQLLCKEIIMIEGGRIVFSDSIDAFNNYLQPHSLQLRAEHMPSQPALLKVAGVSSVEYIGDKLVRIFFEGGQDIADRLIAASVESNWQIREIIFEKGLPDETFRQLAAKSIQ